MRELARRDLAARAQGWRLRVACGVGCGAMAAVLFCTTVSLAAPARVAEGRRIFEKTCAPCHGAKGEGVKEKYADPLIGDWSVAKLTRYIAANMPDDHPGTLVPAEAAAVARYVHDAFYSREAQSRNFPARVELARLTNQQYLITVADLLRGFGAPDPPIGAERGLQAIYYGSAQRGRFDNAKVAHRGVDAQIDFDFGDSGDPVLTRVDGLAEISGQWRGAVWADETGDYEFVLRTPNTIRVWINSDAGVPSEANLDVNVSTPDTPDHRTTVRLLGGRWYPLAIDYWALPGKTGAPPPALALRWKPPHGSERIVPARNLAPVVVPPTLVLATKFPADDSSQGYERSGAISKAWEEATTSAAFEVANYVARKLDALRAAKPVELFAENFVSAAFRRPLAPTEKQRFVTDRCKTAPDLETAIKRVVLLALKAPEFLYTELPARPRADLRQRKGPPTGGSAAPVDFALAGRLSLALWDSLPDAALREAAAAGRLHTRADVAAHAERMLGDPRARAKLQEFFQRWLQIQFVEDVTKDPALFPDFTPEVIDDLRTSLALFVEGVAWSEASDFRELLCADYLVVNERLAKFYGLPPPPAGEWARVAAPGRERSGVLTHPYLLAAFSYRSSTSPIHRGVFLTRKIVGRALKPPPVAQVFDETQFTPGMTMREKVAKLTRSENCQGCHSVINPLGFSLEWFDAVGRYRNEDNGRAIDAASEYQTDETDSVRLAGARDVADFAIGSERANFAFIEQLFHHVVKQPVMAYGPHTLPALRDSFIASGYNLRKLLAEIATFAALRGVENPR